MAGEKITWPAEEECVVEDVTTKVAAAPVADREFDDVELENIAGGKLPSDVITYFDF